MLALGLRIGGLASARWIDGVAVTVVRAQASATSATVALAVVARRAAALGGVLGPVRRPLSAVSATPLAVRAGWLIGVALVTALPGLVRPALLGPRPVPGAALGRSPPAPLPPTGVGFGFTVGGALGSRPPVRVRDLG